MLDGYKAICHAVVKAWKLPEKLKVSTWADKNRMLSGKASAEPGLWRTSRTPYLREIMDTLSDEHPAKDICFMAASQVGKTEVLLNWIGYTVDHAPAPMLTVQPTVDTAEKYSKQRIAPMIELNKRLLAKIPASRKRDSGNTTLVKEFPGGVLVMTGANAASALASMPIKKLALDETDRYPIDVDGEGDPISLAEQRTVTFARAKRYKASTPGRKETSHIAKEYERSSQAKYWVTCPHCVELQTLEFENLIWQKTVGEDGKKIHHPETAAYVCPHCGGCIEERFKPWMLAEENGACWIHAHPERERLGYHINALYSPIGLGLTWVEIAKKWLDACNDPAKLQPFINLQKGLPYEDFGDRVKGVDLEKRAESWPVRTVPEGIFVLTLGVDVQKDRLEGHLVGWGENERCATIDYVIIQGDPEKPEVWEELEKYRHSPVRNAFGVDLQISMTAIDTGYNTHRVYNHVRQCRFDRVIAVKGAKETNRPILSRPTRQDVKNARGDVQKNGVMVWSVGTDTAKNALFSRLASDVEISGETEHYLAPEKRMVRFPNGLPSEFYEQMTAEVYDDRSGRYVKIRQRNEALDTWVYAYAAACHPNVRINRFQAADWEHLKSLIEPRIPDLFKQADEHEKNDRNAMEQSGTFVPLSGAEISETEPEKRQLETEKQTVETATARPETKPEQEHKTEPEPEPEPDNWLGVGSNWLGRGGNDNWL